MMHGCLSFLRLEKTKREKLHENIELLLELHVGLFGVGFLECHLCTVPISNIHLIQFTQRRNRTNLSEASLPNQPFDGDICDSVGGVVKALGGTADYCIGAIGMHQN